MMSLDNAKKSCLAILLVAAMVVTGTVAGKYVTKTQEEPLPTAGLVQEDTDSLYGLLAQPLTQDGDEVDAATIIVQAKDTGKVGELIRFDVSASVAKSFKWLVVPESADFQVYDNGRQAVFSARRPGEYMFIIACAYEGTVDVTTHVVTIEGDPNNPPNPDKYPVVPRPDKDTSVALDEWVTYWCAKSKRSQDETRRLAGSFESVAATIAAGVNVDAKEIAAATAEANRAALGTSIDDWRPVLANISTALKARAEAGNLQTPDQHADLWREIAKGLRDYSSLFPNS